MNKVNRQWLAERPYLLAILITVLLILWMLSGEISAQTTKATQPNKQAPIAKVQVTKMHAEQIHNVVQLYGRTEPDRIATIKSQVRGQVLAVMAKRGSKVKKGQVIAEIDKNDLMAQLRSAKALLKQRKIAYQGAKKLNKQGYQGQAQLAQALADLEQVKASIETLELDIKHTKIIAPFDGVLDERMVEQGDYVKSGEPIAVVADLNPIIVRAFATEQQVSQLTPNQAANVTFISSAKQKGIIRYIASIADKSTNTFKVEVAVANDNYQQLAGMSTEINIPLKEVSAIKISPALLSLDEQGNIGVKSVQNQQVKFTPIDIVKSETDGIWLTGLGQEADIITLGQGFVRDGDKVEAVLAN